MNRRNIREDRKGLRALAHMQVIECDEAIFVWFLCSFAPPFRALVAYHLERDGMPLHDAIEVNCEKGPTT